MKKMLATLLAALMMMSAVACGNNQENKPLNESGTAGEEETVAGFFPAVEKKSYQKETVRLIGMEEPGTWYYSKEMTNSPLNDAIYEMNKTVEDYLDVQLDYEYISSVTTGGEMYATVQPTILSGDDVYQICILHPYYSYNSFISSNSAYDFYEFKSLDLSQEYWNRAVIDSLAINDHAYIALGSLCKYDVYMLYCNKDLMKQAGRTVPYDLVRSGEWTLDEFISITSGLYADNGDGMKNNADTYGFAGMWDANGSAFMQAAGIYVAKRNDNNQFELSLYSDQLVDFYDKLFNWSKDESVYLWGFGDKKNTQKNMDFLDGRSYFTQTALGTDYLSASFDVALLPLPKYDQAQAEYAHVNWGNNLVVPSSIRNPDMVSDVLEMMAYYSSTVVHDAYYDTVLQFRVSNSPDDREMVKLIYNTIVYDPGIAFCDGNNALWNLVYLPCFGIIQNNSRVASYYKTNQRSAQRWLDDLFKEKK